MVPYENWNYRFNTIPDQFNYYNNDVQLTPLQRQRQQALDKPPELTSGNAIYNSYAGVDIVAQVVLPGEAPVALGELQTISYSIHRENSPVRILGHTSPVAFVKSGRTIAGSMIFTVFNNYAFYRLTQFQKAIENRLYPVADMLPPLDIVLTFANEFGVFSKMKIYGVTFIDEGGTMSVDDLITEETFCVDETTEALTKDGWKGYDEISEEDEFLTLDVETKVIEWQQSESINVFDYSGDMIHWSSYRGVDCLTTPNHRWITTNQYQLTKYGFDGATFRFYTTDSIPEGRHIVTSGGTPRCFASDKTFSDELVELVGWTVCEGTLNRNRYNEVYGVQITQSERANEPHVESLRRLVKHFDGQGCSTSVSGLDVNETRKFYFGKGIGRIVGDIVTDEKILTPEFLSLITHDQALMLYNVMLDDDGHRSSTTEHFIQNPGPRLDSFQMLISMLGRKSVVHDKWNAECKSLSIYQSNISAKHGLHPVAVPYEGKVWCPTTPNRTWLARRNGTTFWTGNSYMARGIQPMTGYSMPENVNTGWEARRP